MVKAGGKEIGEGLGISGMTFGILSIVFASYIGIILSIIGFIFSLNQQKNNPTKLGKSGIILNIIGFVLSVAFIIVSIFWLTPLMQKLQTGSLV
ncbi:MAG: hypothetical protein AABY06_01225 [Nanoarchaeota archaeon]